MRLLDPTRGLTVPKWQPVPLVRGPLDQAEGDGADDVEADHDEQLPVERDVAGVEQRDSGRGGLDELEDRERRRRVILPDSTEDGEHLNIVLY